MKNIKLTKIPFIRCHRSGFNTWEKAARIEGFDFHNVKTTYVDICDIKQIAESIRNSHSTTGMVWQGTVGFMSSSWVNKYSSKTPHNYRFGTGIYSSLWELFLVEDVFEWAHRRIEYDKIRSCADIVWKMAGKRSKTPERYFPQ